MADVVVVVFAAATVEIESRCVCLHVHVQVVVQYSKRRWPKQALISESLVRQE